MAATPKKRKKKKGTKRTKGPSGKNLLLTLTLVPLVIGILLIGAWGLDLYIFDDPQSQPLVGLLFMLFSFSASNALQKKRNLAIGWILLFVADLILLLWVDLWAQIIAIICGVVGAGFLLVAFSHRWREDRAKNNLKSK